MVVRILLACLLLVLLPKWAIVLVLVGVNVGLVAYCARRQAQRTAARCRAVR